MMFALQDTSSDELLPWELPPADASGPIEISVMSLLNSYTFLFLSAFVVTLLVTPLIRKAAVASNIVDHPDDPRKNHRDPVAYLGGLAVFLGLLAAIGLSYLPFGEMPDYYEPIPFSIVLGIFVITITGLADDVWGWDPRLKVAGQLVAAAALAIEDVGVRVAVGLLRPVIGMAFGDGSSEAALFAIDWMPLTNGDLYYWVGTAIIAVFVLGGCNAANLLDGLDGLLSGTMSIVAIGLLAIAVLMAVTTGAPEEPSLAGARIALCFALLGACLGFLPHNFNPATIFLGDCGSLLLGYVSVVIILMLGDEGKTHLVFAGLIVFAVPIMDTVLAIMRRKLSGRSMSTADDQHIHHQLRRALGGVKRAVFALYGISGAFALVGFMLAALVVQDKIRFRVVYGVAIVLFGMIGVFAFKAARRQELRMETERIKKRAAARANARPGNGSGAAGTSQVAPTAKTKTTPTH